MRVDNNLPNPWLESLAVSKTESQKTDSATIPNRGASDDSRSVADLPVDSFVIKSPAADTPRTDKVEALQRAIASGTYNVSAENIADAILRDWTA